jgi:hypothetical protein
MGARPALVHNPDSRTLRSPDALAGDHWFRESRTMSEGEGVPAGDARSFLPRPGEPVDAYAERLRALHGDLTLVLEAVERALATAAAAAPPPPAAAPAAEPARSSAPRIEVLPPRAEPRAEPRAADPAADERRLTGEGVEPPPPDRIPAQPREHPARRPPQPFPARPSAAATATPEPEWVERDDERGESFTAATFGPPAPAPRRPTSTALLVAALVAGWLVVLALALVLLLG